MRIFLDANILFSASSPESSTRMLLRAAAAAAELVTSPHAWEEAQRNLAAKRPQNALQLPALREMVLNSHGFQVVDCPGLPLHDQPILAGAVGSQCTHLWTGDKKHFGAWFGRNLCGVTVVSSIMLADLLIEGGWRPVKAI